MKKNTHYLFRAFVVGFSIVMLMLTNLTVFQREKLMSTPANSRRLAGWDNQSLRGGIYARGGEVVAETKVIGGPRRYSMGWAWGPIVGYLDRRLGATGLEASYAAELSGRPLLWSALGFNLPLTARGEDLVLTVDAGLQEKAMRLLAGKKGAAVVLDPRTGAVLALASQPSFDPATVSRDWEEISRDEAAPLLNRATQGLYPPGSTFKLVTAAAALSRNPDVLTRRYFCPGELKLTGYTVHCLRAHGTLDLARALAVSCNVTFARLGLEIGNGALAAQAEQAGFNAGLPFDLPVAVSSFPRGRPGKGETAQRAIGQGEVLATPLELALLAAGIANGGVIMRPYLVQERRLGAWTVGKTVPERLEVAMSPGVAKTLTELMVEVTEHGTGQAAQLPGMKVAGKTGTAENPHGKPHAWYVGFAPAGAPRVAVAVVVENGGSGGTVAAPIARELFETALEVVR
ncbi:MAG: penicillin-binding protein [Bacillota bacterium]|nr:penicillin-binding protein [Bacillota bacterium]MDK2855083.1 penicillin-binding protein [Bacillota bacterium]MDK2925227.1 penicillin-binding protein [Bacillota bacterium]